MVIERYTNNSLVLTTNKISFYCFLFLFSVKPVEIQLYKTFFNNGNDTNMYGKNHKILYKNPVSREIVAIYIYILV